MENNNISLIDGNSLQRKSKSDFNLSASETNIVSSGFFDDFQIFDVTLLPFYFYYLIISTG